MESRAIFILLIFLSVFSCRTTPESETVELGNVTLVNVNASGLEWENSHISANPNEQDISTLGSNRLIFNGLQAKNTIKINDEISIDIFENVKFERSSLSKGAKYLVQAFDYNTGNIADYKINTVGEPINPLKLDGGKSYDIVIYSFNSSEEPPVVFNINDSFSYSHSDNTKEFLYYRASNYSPIGGVNTLYITLKEKFSYAKFVLDTRNLATHNNQGASVVGTPKLSNTHNKSGRINVSNGNFSGNNQTDLYFPMKYKEKDIHESDYIPIALKPGNTSGTFTAEIVAPAEYGEDRKIHTIPINVKSGTKNTFAIKIDGIANATPKINIDKDSRDILILATSYDSGKNDKNVCNALRDDSYYDTNGYITINLTKFDDSLHKINVSSTSNKYIRLLEILKQSSNKYKLKVHGQGCVITSASEIGRTVQENIRVFVTSKKDGKEIYSKTIGVNFLPRENYWAPQNPDRDRDD